METKQIDETGITKTTEALNFDNTDTTVNYETLSSNPRTYLHC
jgi:hypothetical protein